MITNFLCADTEALFNGLRVARFANIQNVALRKLAMLHRAGRLDDLRVPPGNRLEALNRDFPLGAPSALRSRQRRFLGHFRVFSSPMEQPLARQSTQNCLQNPLAAIERPNGKSRLKHNRMGQYSIRINEQWRVCFEWEDGHAFAVAIVDYH